MIFSEADVIVAAGRYKKTRGSSYVRAACRPLGRTACSYPPIGRGRVGLPILGRLVSLGGL